MPSPETPRPVEPAGPAPLPWGSARAVLLVLLATLLLGAAAQESIAQARAAEVRGEPREALPEILDHVVPFRLAVDKHVQPDLFLDTDRLFDLPAVQVHRRSRFR